MVGSKNNYYLYQCKRKTIEKMKNGNTSKTQFEVGKLYGNDLTIEIVSRTEKTITIKTNAWGQKRVKIRDFYDGTESIMFKCWIVCATENFDADESARISMYNAYHK